jgi:hypothetical protein
MSFRVQSYEVFPKITSFSAYYFKGMSRGLKDLVSDFCMKLYDYVYMTDYDEDGGRFKFPGSLFGYKSLIINSLHF